MFDVLRGASIDFILDCTVFLATLCDLVLFTGTPTTYIYTLSLHDALPIYSIDALERFDAFILVLEAVAIASRTRMKDRKSTRLNSSHANISYAVFCLKKKNLQLQRR